MQRQSGDLCAWYARNRCNLNPGIHGAGFRAVARGFQVQAEARRLGLANWIALDDDARDWPEDKD